MKRQCSATPLRYPGGKQKLAPILESVLRMNGLEGCCYVEPFAGGAGVALGLLYEDLVSVIYLNDLDRAIFAFWSCVVNETDALLRRIRDTPVTMDTWHACRRIYCSNVQYPAVDLGFATFFLNRTNRSGIIRGGVIGGQQQTGRWKLDARFNTPELLKRIERVASFRDRIRLFNLDATFFLETVASNLPGRTLVYLDPPYYLEGDRLYRNQFKPKDHKLIADLVKSGMCPNWVVSYDNVPPVLEAYSGCKRITFDLNHSAHKHHFGSEVMFIADHLKLA